METQRGMPSVREDQIAVTKNMFLIDIRDYRKPRIRDPKYGVYRHFKLDNQETFYVGQGKATTRPFDPTGRSPEWMVHVFDVCGGRYGVQLINSDLTGIQALYQEALLIEEYRKLGRPLVNKQLPEPESYLCQSCKENIIKDLKSTICNECESNLKARTIQHSSKPVYLLDQRNSNRNV